ncbi:MAG: Utp14 protein-domain-containing protein [Linnemannia gamsii]|nr:MAG: Utp14 protein-domain-containing protein [Linnemannia gamsii]
MNRKPQANNHSRKARGAAAAAAAESSGSGKTKAVKSLANVFSLDDEDESKSARRRKQYLDEVENYEYNVDEIDDEDDEEIDSDEAFDEEDEEKYENFQFYGSKDQAKKNKKKQQLADKKDMDQDESSEEEEESEEEEGAEYMDISEMLNQPQSDDEIELPKKTKVVGFNDTDSEADDFKFGGDDDDEDEDSDEDEDEEEADEEEGEDMDEDEAEGTASNLTSFIDSLETSVKKRKQDDATSTSAKKARKNLRERTEAYDESEYNLQAHRSSAAHSLNGPGNKKKLDMFDLVSSIQDEAGFSSLKKNVQALESSAKKGQPVETLTAPLPKIVQDRLNRQAAYDESKKEVSKWLPIVQQNRQAEHLAFPMNAPAIHNASSASLASSFGVTTKMEREVESVLMEGGMQERKLVEFEELALNKMTTEEVEKRRNDLRMMRELMFRDEIRAKRVSKIKSKLYRKIKKKERERNGLTAEEMQELDPAAAHEERLLAEQKRAQERMTLKHKNSGKWAKDQLKHGNFDPESRQAITEQIERGDRLRRKIQDVDSDEEQSGGDSDYSDLEDDDIEGVKARAFDELAQVEHQLAKAEDAAKEAKVGKGVFAMKFMQDAAKRSKIQAQIAADEFRKEMMEEEEMAAMSSEDEWKSVQKKKKGGKAREAEAGTKDAEAGSDDDVQIDTNSFLTLSKDSQKVRGLNKDDTTTAASAPAPTTSKKNNKKAAAQSEESAEGAVTVAGDGNDSDDSEPEPVMVHAKTTAALSQRDLVARAFANDNVVSEFEKEKMETMEADKPKDIDLTLPGWGSWAGKGQKKKKNVVVKKAQPGEGVEASKRKDAKLAHVIINERRDKKASHYAVTKIPHPFKTWAQYEQSLRAPVGKEWNTNATFQKMTLPRITTKLGKIIDPLSAPFK